MDIMERKLTERENEKILDNIQEEKDRLQALINSMNDEVWFVDTQKS